VDDSGSGEFSLHLKLPQHDLGDIDVWNHAAREYARL
jgi:hypothetical protein